MRLQDDEAGMTALAITLASVLLVSVTANAALGWWLRTARNEQARDNEKHLDERIALNELASKYEKQRNEQAIAAATGAKRIGELEQILRETSAQRDDAVRRAIKAKAEEIRNAPTDADALAEFNRMRGQAVLPKAGDADPGGNDR